MDQAEEDCMIEMWVTMRDRALRFKSRWDHLIIVDDV